MADLSVRDVLEKKTAQFAEAVVLHIAKMNLTAVMDIVLAVQKQKHGHALFVRSVLRWIIWRISRTDITSAQPVLAAI